jgi:hypothetical protein
VQLDRLRENPVIHAALGHFFLPFKYPFVKCPFGWAITRGLPTVLASGILLETV